MLAHSIFFYFFSIIAILSSLMVITSRNTVNSVFFLILDFISVGCLFIMVKSRFCSTNIKKEVEERECRYDPGGYFIVNGNEKVIMSVEKMVDNKILVFTKKDNTFKDKLMHMCQINSKPANNINANIQIIIVIQ